MKPNSYHCANISSLLQQVCFHCIHKAIKKRKCQYCFISSRFISFHTERFLNNMVWYLILIFGNNCLNISKCSTYNQLRNLYYPLIDFYLTYMKITDGFYFNMVQLEAILHVSQKQWRQSMNSQRTPHILCWWAHNYWVSFMSICKK